MSTTIIPHRLTAKTSPRELPDILAYPRCLLQSLSGVLQFSAKYIMGGTPQGLEFRHGAFTAFVAGGADYLSLPQSRVVFNLSLQGAAAKDGLGTPAAVARVAAKVEGKGWHGYWLPFQDQLHTVKGTSKDNEETTADDKIGEGCDMVLFYTHGGGFIYGSALGDIGYLRSVMKAVQRDSNLKVGILSIEYSLSPETPLPGALNECVAAYSDLVQIHGVDSKRIILVGESAGANLAHVVSLKMRDEYPELGMPAGVISVSPYLFCTEPMKFSHLDIITPLSCERFVEAYSQHRPEVLSSQYYTPTNAKTLEGLPPMLVYIGGVEVFRPSIEKFVKRAKEDKVEVETVLAEGRAHCWALETETSTKNDREVFRSTFGQFVDKIFQRVGSMERTLERTI